MEIRDTTTGQEAYGDELAVPSTTDYLITFSRYKQSAKITVNRKLNSCGLLDYKLNLEQLVNVA